MRSDNASECRPTATLVQKSLHNTEGLAEKTTWRRPLQPQRAIAWRGNLSGGEFSPARESARRDELRTADL